MDSRIALVTGANKGIGREIVRQLAGLGTTVLLGARDKDRRERAAADLRAEGLQAVHPIALDVTDPETIASAAAEIDTRFGRLDVLVNNAAGNFVVKAEELSPNGWRAVVSIVLDGGWLCTSAAARQMIAQGEGGAICLVIASYAWTGGPGTVHSASAKAGLLAMTKTLAVEWAPHNIRVNTICPGPTDTEGAGGALWPTADDRARVEATVPAGRLASVEEIGWWTTALCSPFAAYITGTNLTIDGGHSLEQDSYMPAWQPRA